MNVIDYLFVCLQKNSLEPIAKTSLIYELDLLFWPTNHWNLHKRGEKSSGRRLRGTNTACSLVVVNPFLPFYNIMFLWLSDDFDGAQSWIETTHTYHKDDIVLLNSPLKSQCILFRENKFTDHNSTNRDKENKIVEYTTLSLGVLDLPSLMSLIQSDMLDTYYLRGVLQCY